MVSFLSVFIAWLVQGFVGLGSGIISTAILLFFFDPKKVVVSLSIIALIGTLFLSFSNYRGKFFLKEVFVLLFFSFLGAGAGSYLLKILSPEMVEFTFGIFVVITGIYDFLSQKKKFLFKLKLKNILAMLTGFFGGLISGLIGGAGPLYALYINQFFHSKEDFKFVISFVFTVLNLERIVFYLFSPELRGAFSSEIIIPALPGVFLGAFLGDLFSRKVSNKFFKEIVSISIIVFGVYFMFQGLLN